MLNERQEQILKILKEREFILVQELAEALFVSEITPIICGGTYRAKTASLTNPFFETMFQMIFANKVFWGVTEFNIESGFSCNDFFEYDNKRQIIKSGKEIYFLADSSKLNRKDGKASIRLCEMKKEYHLITDSLIMPEVRERLEAICHLHIAQIGKE